VTPARRALAVLAAAALALFALGAALAPAQTGGVPFFDLSRKPDRPDLAGLRTIRFLTDDDYPPFHFLGPDGQLTGFNVDLARAICAELKLACTIQARRWDTLIPVLEQGGGDAVIASLADTEAARARVDFSVPYYRSPARFVAPKSSALADASRAALADRPVAVVANSAHAAFLAAFFPRVRQIAAVDQAEALRLLRGGSVAAVFGDGVGLALWLGAEEGRACCHFLGGPFYEPRYFGEGAAIAFRKDAAQLRRAVDWALYRLVEQGIYQDLMLKYFAASFY
jgi:polar amino acid transport system substrate-binding protein